MACPGVKGETVVSGMAWQGSLARRWPRGPETCGHPLCSRSTFPDPAWTPSLGSAWGRGCWVGEQWELAREIRGPVQDPSAAAAECGRSLQGEAGPLGTGAMGCSGRTGPAPLKLLYLHVGWKTGLLRRPWRNR